MSGGPKRQREPRSSGARVLGVDADHAWRALSLAAIVLAALSLALDAQLWSPAAEEPTEAPEAAVEELVRELLMEHPDIVVAALNRFVEEQEATARQQEHDLVAAHADRLLADPSSPEVGNPSGDVTLVEFIDYQCGFCKRAHPMIKELLSEDGNIRLVFKEIPILGPTSVLSAEAVLSARDHDRFEDFHDALMEERVQLNETRVFEIAASVGLDVEALREEMERNREVHQQVLAQNIQLARTLGIRGTPGFVVGDRVIRGVVDLPTLRELVNNARGGRTTTIQDSQTGTDG